MNTNQTQGVTNGKQLTGVVVSVKGTKTIIVEVAKTWRHPLYKKQIRSVKRIAAHMPEGAVEVGQRVIITETRPISRTKHFRFVEVLK